MKSLNKTCLYLFFLIIFVNTAGMDTGTEPVQQRKEAMRRSASFPIFPTFEDGILINEEKDKRTIDMLAETALTYRALVTTDIYLSGDRLHYLPRNMEQFQELRILDLSNNFLVELPDNIDNLAQLAWLNVSENNLKALPESIVNLEKLETLDITKNKITRLPPGFFSLPNLKYFFAYGNILENIKHVENIDDPPRKAHKKKRRNAADERALRK